MIAHNQIDHTPYTAISFGWGGWHTDTTHADNPNVSGWNTIAENLIYDYMATLPDGGAIYTNGTQAPPDPAGPGDNPALTLKTSADQMRRGLSITGNVALLATWSEFAYYNDEGSDYITYGTTSSTRPTPSPTVGATRSGTSSSTTTTGPSRSRPTSARRRLSTSTLSNHHVLPDHPGPATCPSACWRTPVSSPRYRDDVVVSPARGHRRRSPAGAERPGRAGERLRLHTRHGGVLRHHPRPARRARPVSQLPRRHAPSSAAPGQVDITVRTPRRHQRGHLSRPSTSSPDRGSEERPQAFVFPGNLAHRNCQTNRAL